MAEDSRVSANKVYAWEKALKYYRDNGSHEVSNDVTKRCVKLAQYALVPNSCWSELIVQYPRTEGEEG